MDLSIIIINYNLTLEIENCLNSLLDKFDSKYELNYEIIIVDNNSTENNLSELENKFNDTNIHFYYLKENLGFGMGCNFGNSKASGKYICFLNPDTIIVEQIFSPIIKLFENDKSIGIVGPQQQIRPPFFDFSAGFYPNIIYEFFNLFGVGVFLEGLILTVLKKIKAKEKINVDWILGAALFIRSDLFNQINGFDKDYFMFFEEVDLCKRVSKKGFKIIYFPKLKIHHIGSVSGKKDYKLYTIRTYSSKNLYISKHYRFLNKYLMKFFLVAQLFSQIVIWTFLFPKNNIKSRQKLSAFLYLLKHRMNYEHWN